ncbi:hypothetical protein PENSUB_9397 [Penicillium subrubescens]|uniref:Uncharacterized protein n=1 Tax=Penicillium subrubescens TaxID=1316194 RepID=A0A1Q5TDL8_9EURO|nr:hypothetical protein PENSUB_9397 [Penicillium subrubescens]
MLIPVKISVHLQFQSIQPNRPSRTLPEGRRKDHGIVNPPTTGSITQGTTQMQSVLLPAYHSALSRNANLYTVTYFFPISGGVVELV